MACNIARVLGCMCLVGASTYVSADQTSDLVAWAGEIRKDFPFVERAANADRTKPYVYFDNGATTQKPKAVIDCICDIYSGPMANIGRGEHAVAMRLNETFESARTKIADFIGAQSQEVIFTRGTTDSLNCAALMFGRKFLKPGDEILTTELEHHSNYIPWQQAALRQGAIFKVIPMTADGCVDMEAYKKLLSPKTKLVAVVHVSNVIGVPNPVRAIADLAHAVGARVMVDAAQSMGHIPVNVNDLGADFLACSGHKMLGPTGIGVLYIRADLLTQLDPCQYGGGMVFDVTPTTFEWHDAPSKFESGTPSIVQAIALGAAVDYITSKIDFEKTHAYEALLAGTLIDGLQQIPGVKILGPVDRMRHDGHLVSFHVEGVESEALSAFLDQNGIATRAGYHCTIPLHDALGLHGSIRASFHVYNTLDEVYYLIDTVKKFIAMQPVGVQAAPQTRAVRCTARA